MLKILKLRYKNLLSSGNSWIELEFNNKLNTLITGTNGSGKSTVNSALVFALYGKDFRGINKNGLVNSINKKNLVCECLFERNGNTYKVIRGIKPNIFEIYKNDTLLEQQAFVKDQQNWFEEEILQFPYNTFKQIVITGSGNYIPFMKLAAGQRREFIENLLDLGVISQMQQRLKDKISNDKEELNEAETKLRICNEKISFAQKQVKESSKQRQEDKLLLEQQKERLHDECKILSDSVVLIEQKIEELSTKLAKIDKIEIEYNKAKTDASVRKSKISDINSKISRLTSLTKCPTCQQEVGEDHKHEISSSFSEELSVLKTEFDNFNEEVSKRKEIVDKKIPLMDALLSAERKKSSLDSTKISNLERIDQINSNIDKLTNAKDSITYDLDGLLVERLSDEVSVKEKKDVMSINDALVVLLKDTGIKSILIKQYVEMINTLVNKYLEYFDFYVNFTIDEQFSEKIKSRHRDEFTYENFSEGEKLRIDLSLLFTFREIAKMKSNLDCNLILFDEVLDSAMDGDGLNNLYQIFELLDDTTIYVISHRTEAAEMFDRTLNAVKRNNFSTLEEV